MFDNDELFDFSKHDCKNCKEFDKCQIKDAVDYFRNNKDELVRVIELCHNKFHKMLESPDFFMLLTTEPKPAIIFLMHLAYVMGRKEESVSRLEKLNYKGVKND